MMDGYIRFSAILGCIASRYIQQCVSNWTEEVLKCDLACHGVLIPVHSHSLVMLLTALHGELRKSQTGAQTQQVNTKVFL